MFLPIFIGSKSDECFLAPGLAALASCDVPYEVIVGSVHRNPKATLARFEEILASHQDIRVIVAGANAAGGLPGVLAGYLRDTNIVPLGVRFSHDPGPSLIEDASFVLSSLPSGQALCYLGYNEKGFENACIVACRILGKYRSQAER